MIVHARHGALIVRIRVLLNLRSLPEGRAARGRAALIGLVGLVIAVMTLRPNYAAALLLIRHIAAGPHATTRIDSLFGHTSALSEIPFFIAGTILTAQCVRALDMQVLAATPVSPRLIVATTMVAMWLVVSALFCAASIPLIIGLSGPFRLGVGDMVVACLIMPSLLGLPLALGMLLGVAILRFLPAQRARSLTSLLAPLITTSVGAVARLVALLAPHGPLGSAAQTLARAWALSPFSWTGQALAALLRHDTVLCARLVGENLALTTLIVVVLVPSSRDLLSAGWGAYTNGTDGHRRRGRGGLRVAVPAASDLFGTGSPPGAARAGWRAIIKKEWLLARRDGEIQGRVIFGLYAIMITSVPTMATAPRAVVRAIRVLKIRPHTVMTLPLLGLVGALVSVVIVVMCGGIMVTLLNRSWGREMGVRDIVARTPIDPFSVLWALGLFYAFPCGVLAMALAFLSALVIPLPLGSLLATAPVILAALCVLAAVTLTVNVRWPGQRHSTIDGAAVPQSWRARWAATVADLSIAPCCAIALIVDAFFSRHPLVIVVVDAFFIVLATLVVLVCRRVSTRALARLYSGV